MNKQFEEWLYNGDKVSITDYLFLLNKRFDELPFSMQWGVYLSFFDSVGILLQVYPTSDLNPKQRFAWLVKYQKELEHCEVAYLDRTEAQQEAIKKAFEILEEK